MTSLAAAPGTVLAGRYRLERPIAHRPATTLWRGVDDVLARPVAVKVVHDAAALPGGTARFLDAAVAAGRLTHPRITRTYDAAEEGGLVYVVTEWFDGRALVDVLADGALPPTRATTIAAQVAETVVYAGSRGVRHGDLTAHNVLVAADGTVKVTDFELGAASAGPVGDPGQVPPDQQDTRAVAAVLYACLTGRSAYGAEPELPLAPRRDGRLLAPRQVRAGVPREVDAVVVRTLLPDLLRHSRPISTAEDLLGALAALPGDSGVAPPPAADAAEPAPPRRLLRVGLPMLVVGGVAVAGLLAGLAIGRVPGAAPKYPGLNATTSPGATSAAGQPLRPVAVRDFDPQGDGAENHNQVPLATDTEVDTAWTTTTYFRSPAFGGLKSGVGLLVDFGAPVRPSRVRVAFARAGVSLELRSANALSSSIADFPVAASVASARTEVELTVSDRTPARYWVLWLTRLTPTDNGKFAAGIAEFAFYS